MMVEVTRVDRLTPHMVRVVLAGEDLSGFATHGPAEHIKVFLPRAGQERPILPEWGPGGPVFAEGQERPLSRTYTPRLWDAGRLELSVDFLVHGDGPGSAWALQARPGQTVAVGGAGGAYRPDESAAWYLLAGDESAIPAIGTILDALPATTAAKVLIEVSSASEQQPLSSAAVLELRWLHRGSSDPSQIGRLLERTILAADLPAGPGRAFVACEAEIMRDIKPQLLFGRGLAREAVHCHGYWKLGEANHPDHDIAQEI
jgi:NADPH-dependent ferric siderophore reductase